ncbi:MAG: histidine triad nucleotide-binding protein [Planctomycetota bacterium]
MSACLLCRIERGEIPAAIVRREPRLFAFRDIHPQAPQHILIVPTKHIARLDDLSADDSALAGELVLAATSLAREQGCAASGYRLVWNCGTDGGQSVDHIHLHLLGGRRLGWPPG